MAQDNAYVKAYNVMYKKREENRNQNIIDMVKYGLLRKQRDNTILNIGSGPSESVKLFMATLSVHCKKIVLCEVNTEYCQQYIESDWYKKNEDKIEIYNCKFEDIKIMYKFDLIWMQHVIYHFHENYFGTLIKKLSQLLVGKNGYCIIGLGDENNTLTKNVYKKIAKYELCDQLRNTFNNNTSIEWFTLTDDSLTYFDTKQDAFKLFKLFVTQSLLVLDPDDYNVSETTIDKTINDAIDNSNLLQYYQTRKQYLWINKTRFFTFRCNCNKDLDENSHMKSRL